MIRLAAGLSAALALILLLVWQQSRLPAEVRISRQLSGEHWYTIELSGHHVGYLHTRSQGLADGGWRYDSHTHILLESDAPVNIRKRLEFDGKAPWNLRTAEQRVQRGSAPEESTGFVMRDGKLLAISTDGQHLASGRSSYTLGDFLHIERWLVDADPPLQSRIRTPTLAFESGRVRSSAYTLIDRDANGVTLQSEASIGPTLTRLLPSLLPGSIDVAGAFRFTLSDQATALDVSSPAFHEAYLLPVDSRIPDPTLIESMRLTALEKDSGRTLLEVEARAQTLSSAAGSALPARSLPQARIDELAREAGLDGPSGNDGERIHRMLELLQQRLTYREGAAPDSLSAVLDRGYGECTDFADLLTVLAQHSGLAARTVIGLAYRDRKPYGFAFHAWNEVRVDGTWEVIDPTWGQRYADATHLPLDDHDLATLKLYGSQQNAVIAVSRIVSRDT